MEIAEEAEALRHYLASYLGRSSVSFGEPPRVVPGGYVNRILRFRLADAPAPLDQPLVLRLFPGWADAESVTAEFARQRSAFELGYPVPEPLLVETDRRHLGTAFTLMKHAGGVTLLHWLLSRPTRLPRAAQVMADALLHLQDLPVEDFAASGARDRTQYTLAALAARAGPDGYPSLMPVVEWLERNAPADQEKRVICHGDFNPTNILVDRKGNVTGVIDWANATIADRHLDVADCSLVLKAAPAGENGVLKVLIRAGRDLFAQRFLAAYNRRRRIAAERLRYFEVLAACRRLIGALDDRPPTSEERPRGLTSPEYISRLTHHIARISGVEPAVE